jgi:D-alanyl-D-alanine carboxypeptidase
MLAPALLLSLTACGSPQPEPRPVTPTDAAPLGIGPGAVDTTGGWLPDGKTLSPFETSNPIIGWLDPPLLKAIQDATRKAKTAGIDIEITSGWRSRGFQQRLLDDAVGDYGSIEAARRFVATPDVSEHVEGKAVDIAPVEADRWLIANGSQFGLCQIYANELWHFELAVDGQGRCPPLKPNAAG